MSMMQRFYGLENRCVFVTTKTFRNIPVFHDAEKARALVECMQFLAKKKYINLIAWVIMPDHVHMLVEVIGKKNISQIMHDFKSYAVQKISPLILRRSRGFHASATKKVVISSSRGVEASTAGVKYVKLWQTSFHDHVIRDERDYRNHIWYIHNNPVKHGVAQKPEDWSWSNYYEFTNIHEITPEMVRKI